MWKSCKCLKMRSLLKNLSTRAGSLSGCNMGSKPNAAQAFGGKLANIFSGLISPSRHIQNRPENPAEHVRFFLFCEEMPLLPRLNHLIMSRCQPAMQGPGQPHKNQKSSCAEKRPWLSAEDLLSPFLSWRRWPPGADGPGRFFFIEKIKYLSPAGQPRHF